MLIEKEIILSNQLKISYLDNELPDAKTLVFVHGWAADKYNLKGIYQHFIKDYRVIVPDLPGFGFSLRPQEVPGSKDYAEIMLLFFQTLQLKTINYIGHSFGGKIGIILAAFNPDLIKRLVLIDSSGLKPKHYPDWYVKVGFYKILKFLVINFFKNKNKLEKLKQHFGSDDYRSAGNMRDILVKTVKENYIHLLPQIHCPVFLYWGKKDRDTPLWMAKKMQHKIKDASLYIVENGSHFSFLEDLTIVPIIRSFVV